MSRFQTLAWSSLLAVPVVAMAVAGPVQSALGETVRMRSGDVLAGDVKDLGDRVRVQQGSSSVTVPWRDVDVIFEDKTPADLFTEKRSAVKKDDVPALFQLALWAERAGLSKQRNACLEAILEIDPEHTAARSGLQQQKTEGKWLGGAKLLEAKGFVGRDGRWMLKEEAERLDRLAAARKELTDTEKRVEQLVRQAAAGGPRARKFADDALATFSPEDLRIPALRLLNRGEPAEREIAAGMLGRIGDVDTIRPLVFHAIMDRSAAVRNESVAALQEIDHPDKVKPFIRALDSEVPAIRMNSAEALGAFGGGAAVEWLIKRVMSTGGIGTRNSLSVINQLSYISDFDVEIAQAAQIGDPIVQTLREGVILDTRVLGVVEEYTTIERRVLYNALARATGEDHGEDLTAWARWYLEEGKEKFASK